MKNKNKFLTIHIIIFYYCRRQLTEQVQKKPHQNLDVSMRFLKNSLC